MQFAASATWVEDIERRLISIEAKLDKLAADYVSDIKLDRDHYRALITQDTDKS
jgi:hypothetical protein